MGILTHPVWHWVVSGVTPHLKLAGTPGMIAVDRMVQAAHAATGDVSCAYWSLCDVKILVTRSSFQSGTCHDQPPRWWRLRSDVA